jgi:hypothetical protein
VSMNLRSSRNTDLGVAAHLASGGKEGFGIWKYKNTGSSAVPG